MTDNAKNGAKVPPKKRSFFKKAAWQTSAKAEDDQEEDIFSHSNSYKDIVAEQAKAKKDEKKRREEERQRTDEIRQGKKRKVSAESSKTKLPTSGSGDSPQAMLKARSPHSPLPLQPTPDSLSARDKPVTQPSGVFAVNRTEIVDLGPPSGSETSEETPKPSTSQSTALDDEVEEVEDPLLAELAAKARANHGASPIEEVNPIVQLLITSVIPETKPLLINIRISSKVERPRVAFCQAYGISGDRASDIFLTWKRKRLFDSTKIARLGVSVDPMGLVSVEGDSTISDGEAEVVKIHLEAWTDELFKEMQEEEAKEAASRRRIIAPSPVDYEAQIPEETQPRVKKTRLILKAKGLADFKISVNPDTTFEHLTSAYKEALKIPVGQNVTLMFDGERLPVFDTIVDAEIEDMDTIEVHLK
ncbi:uncharacterized protein BDR25DRAFT_331964 [Lindgomyces ingoldianus]|uniref:Uncharacterized protein n=1 Tax=Lindgomyces ingoldianus TaxID=673940 RepID=A0ACB6R619_9PLEO|nr:uncharacterized protein BDR25DRAFT_331964 [Lindgomyces ingoldianus]KAF2474512.1 hypothetical protein BDR25DRAFT_331964 [Lindgomyces ingoldianus]